MPAIVPTNNRMSKQRPAMRPPTSRNSFVFDIKRSRVCLRAAALSQAGDAEIIDGEIVEDGRVEEQAIEPIEQTAVSGQNLRRILRARAAFEYALSQIANDAKYINQGRQWQCRN